MKTIQKLTILLAISCSLIGFEIFAGSSESFSSTFNKVWTPPVSDHESQILFLDSTNTPYNIPDNTLNFWKESSFYATPSRYTQFHYKYPQKRSASHHVILSNYGNGVFIQNSQPIRSIKTIKLSVSATYWSHLEIRVSNTYSEDIVSKYELLEGHTLASFEGGLSQEIAFNTNKLYFSIHKQSGAEIELKSLSVQYYC